jgi:tripartite-type tricarboxylate transporter receptor subunit TctC
MSENMSQTVIIENKAGATGALGAQAVAQSPPDGYVILLGGTGHAINHTLNPKLGYDIFKDLAPVSLVAEGPNLLVIHPSVPARTIPEFIALLKANPGKYSFGSAGRGTSSHLFGELLKVATGVDIVHIPYTGTGPMMNDLIAGRIQFAIDNLPVPLAQAQAGTLIALGVTSVERWPGLPDTPSISEFLPSVVGTSWQGFFVPAGTPQPIIEKLSREVQQAVSSPEVSKRIYEYGTRPMTNTPADLALFLRTVVDRWAEVIKASGNAPQL